MMYPLLTLNDETEVTHSDMLPNGKVKVCFERPNDNGFDNATCYIPGYVWSDIKGFSKKDMKFLSYIVHSTAHLIMRYSQEGGSIRASDV